MNLDRAPSPPQMCIRDREDEDIVIRKSHENPLITKLYDEFLGKPGSHKAHDLLHTHYTKRGRYFVKD